MANPDTRSLRPSPEAEEVFKRWLEHLDEEFTKHKKPALRGELVRDALHQLYLGRPHGGKLNFSLTSELPFNVLQLTLDPANVTLESEYYSDIDAQRYAERKPLIYFWQMFDRSAAGINQWLGFRLRAMLARHIFRKMGKNVKFFREVRFTYGYNLSIEDDCVIRRHVVLDDRGEVTIGKGVVLHDYVRIYSHRHNPENPAEVTNASTVIAPGVTVYEHSSVLGGVTIGEKAIVTPKAVVTEDVKPDTIVGGVPARCIRKRDESHGTADEHGYEGTGL